MLKKRLLIHLTTKFHGSLCPVGFMSPIGVPTHSEYVIQSIRGSVKRNCSSSEHDVNCWTYDEMTKSVPLLLIIHEFSSVMYEAASYLA